MEETNQFLNKDSTSKSPTIINSTNVNDNVNNNVEENGNKNSDDNIKGESKEKFSSVSVFNNTLQEFLKLDQEIKKLSKAIKIRRDKKNQLSEMILVFLNNNEIKSVELGGDYSGKFIEEETKIKPSGFNKETVNQVLIDYFKNNVEDYNLIMKKIDEKMIKKETTKLKISKLIMNKKDIKKLEENMKNSEIQSLMNE